MPYAILAGEILADPLGRGYDAMSDVQVAESLDTADRLVVEPFRATWRDMMATFGPTRTAAIKEAIEAAEPDRPGLAIALEMLGHYGDGGGLDVGHDYTRDTLDVLAAAGDLGAADVEAIKSLAERNISRAAELGLGEIRPGDVARVRRMTQAEGAEHAS